jgi:hypothetical protein
MHIYLDIKHIKNFEEIPDGKHFSKILQIELKDLKKWEYRYTGM